MSGLSSKYQERQRLQGGVRLRQYLRDTKLVLTLQYVLPDVLVAQRLRVARDSLMRLDKYWEIVKP